MHDAGQGAEDKPTALLGSFAPRPRSGAGADPPPDPAPQFLKRHRLLESPLGHDSQVVQIPPEHLIAFEYRDPRSDRDGNHTRMTQPNGTSTDCAYLANHWQVGLPAHPDGFLGRMEPRDLGGEELAQASCSTDICQPSAI